MTCRKRLFVKWLHVAKRLPSWLPPRPILSESTPQPANNALGAYPDLVLASGVVEGAARYVVGERLDQSGMRWVVQRAEAVLLRCIEVNGDWEKYFAWEDQS